MKRIIAIAVLSAFLFVSAASAHEHQTFRIGGKQYEIVIGSIGEPVVVDDKTGVDLRVTSEGQPVLGLDQTLKVEISAGDRKKTLDLAAAFGNPGGYRAVFMPTVQTTYTYRLLGTINSVPVDLAFTCNPAGHPQSPEDHNEVTISPNVVRLEKGGAFGCPLAKADVGFPEPAVAQAELNSKAEAAEEKIGDLASRNMNMAALALGALGTGFGVAAWRRKP